MYLKLSESGRTDGNNSNTHTFEQVTCSYDITITKVDACLVKVTKRLRSDSKKKKKKNFKPPSPKNFLN